MENNVEFKIDDKKPNFMIYKSIADEINKINEEIRQLKEKLEELKKKGDDN